eukprot:jgi/Ulvmu1/9633/UM054_0065.1
MMRRARPPVATPRTHLRTILVRVVGTVLCAAIVISLALRGRTNQTWLSSTRGDPHPQPSDPSSHALAAVASSNQGASMPSFQRSRMAVGSSTGASAHGDGSTGASAVAATAIRGLGDPADSAEHAFPFRLPREAGSWTYADMAWCPGSQEPPADAVPTVDARLRMLMIIGAQKAGTTWLHHALETHSRMVQGITRAKKALGTRSQGKELQFFSRWPPLGTDEFMSMWPEEEIAAMLNGTSRKFLIDATPEYLAMPAAAPRVKQMLPHAKIVIVLRDPVERSFSSWSMQNDRKSYCGAPGASVSLLCVEPTFIDTFKAFRSRREFAERSECEFRTPGADVTWGDCFSCLYGSYENSTCMARMREGSDVFACDRKQLDIFDYSTYAAQISWWLHFFPPEQMLITTSDLLKDEKRRVEFLNQVLDFVGLEDAGRFKSADVNKATAFNGQYNEADDADEAAKTVVRKYYEPQARDLRMLLRQYFPADHLQLKGFPLEK